MLSVEGFCVVRIGIPSCRSESGKSCYRHVRRAFPVVNKLCKRLVNQKFFCVMVLSIYDMSFCRVVEKGVVAGVDILKP